jgi:hypothetical protein
MDREDLAPVHFLSPEGESKLAHGASRRSDPERSPGTGRKNAAGEKAFRPVPGLWRASCHSPGSRLGYFLSPSGLAGPYCTAIVIPVWLCTVPICTSSGSASPGVTLSGTTALICVKPATEPGAPPA